MPLMNHPSLSQQPQAVKEGVETESIGWCIVILWFTNTGGHRYPHRKRGWPGGPRLFKYFIVQCPLTPSSNAFNTLLPFEDRLLRRVACGVARSALHRSPTPPPLLSSSSSPSLSFRKSNFAAACSLGRRKGDPFMSEASPVIVSCKV
jgi:hypothetical protein